MMKTDIQMQHCWVISSTSLHSWNFLYFTLYCTICRWTATWMSGQRQLHTCQMLFAVIMLHFLHRQRKQCRWVICWFLFAASVIQWGNKSLLSISSTMWFICYIHLSKAKCKVSLLCLCNIQERETLQQQKDLLLKEKEALEVEKLSFVRTLDSLRRDVKEREKQVSSLVHHVISSAYDCKSRYSSSSCMDHHC